MRCVLCNEPAEKTSIFFPGAKSQLILGAKEPGQIRGVMFGICEAHLDENGDYKEGVQQEISKAILSRVREPGIPKIDSPIDVSELLKDLDGESF